MIASDDISRRKIFLFVLVLIIVSYEIMGGRSSQETYLHQDLFPNMIVEEGCKMAQVIGKRRDPGVSFSEGVITFQGRSVPIFTIRTKTGVTDYILSDHMEDIYSTVMNRGWIKICGEEGRGQFIFNVNMV